MKMVGSSRKNKAYDDDENDRTDKIITIQTIEQQRWVADWLVQAYLDTIVSISGDEIYGCYVSFFIENKMK